MDENKPPMPVVHALSFSPSCLMDVIQSKFMQSSDSNAISECPFGLRYNLRPDNTYAETF